MQQSSKEFEQEGLHPLTGGAEEQVVEIWQMRCWLISTGICVIGDSGFFTLN